MSRDQGPTGSGSSHAVTAGEAAILHVLLEAEFPGRDVLAAQLRSARVTLLDSNGSLRFEVREGGQAGVVRRIPVEAETEDGDGVTVHLLLHVVDGLLNELEIYREDSKSLKRAIDPSALRVLDL